MIYYYFATKDELFLAVVEEIYHALLDDLGAALSGDAPLEARLRKMSERIGDMSDDERDVAKLIVREMLSSSSRRGRLIERFQRGHLGMIVRAVAEGVANDEIDTRHHPFVVTMATFALGAMPHMVRQLAGDVPPFSSAPHGSELASQLIDILFHGIAPKPSPPKET
jgi:AcrR family transcriptional regulator